MEAQRLRRRLTRIDAGEQGWQGTAWALEHIYPDRFARPEVMNQIAVVNQGGKASAERVIVLPGEEFDTLIGRPGAQRWHIDADGRQQGIPHLLRRPRGIPDSCDDERLGSETRCRSPLTRHHHHPRGSRPLVAPEIQNPDGSCTIASISSPRFREMRLNFPSLSSGDRESTHFCG